MGVSVIHNRVGQHVFRVDPDLWDRVVQMVGSNRYADVGAWIEEHDPSGFWSVVGVMTGDVLTCADCGEVLSVVGRDLTRADVDPVPVVLCVECAGVSA